MNSRRYLVLAKFINCKYLYKLNPNKTVAKVEKERDLNIYYFAYSGKFLIYNPQNIPNGMDPRTLMKPNEYKDLRYLSYP